MEALALLEAGSRQIVENIISSPGFGVSDPKARRVIANAVVGEVMERPARDLDGMVVALIMGACRRCVENLRRELDRAGTSAHIPAGVLVNVALVPTAMAAPTLAAAEKHLETCELCRSHADFIREATTRVNNQPAPEVPSSSTSSDRDLESAMSEAELAEDSAETNAQAANRTLEGFAREKASELRTTRAQRKPPPKVRSRVVDPRTGAAVAGSTRKTWLLVIPAVFVLAFGLAWLLDNREKIADRPGIRQELASLAVRPPPPLPKLDARPASATPAFQDLENGSCGTAASRFRKTRRKEPNLGLLWYWEGISYICAGNGPEAVQALTGASEHASRDMKDLAWYRAQAALLAGDSHSAIEHLGQAALENGTYKNMAADQKQKVQKLVD